MKEENQYLGSNKQVFNELLTLLNLFIEKLIEYKKSSQLSEMSYEIKVLVEAILSHSKPIGGSLEKSADLLKNATENFLHGDKLFDEVMQFCENFKNQLYEL